MADGAETDAELIARVVVRDDRHAFGTLVQRHQSAVRATLRRLTGGNHALADDLAQETFLLAYRNLRSFRQEAKFSTWLYRIATNAFLAEARRRKEAQLGDGEPDGNGSGSDDDAAADGGNDGPGVPDPSRAADLHHDLERALALLSDGERAAIVQCYHNDLSHEEAAYVLGMPVGTVKTHLLRGKQKLRTLLAAWGPRSAAAVGVQNQDPQRSG